MQGTRIRVIRVGVAGLVLGLGMAAHAQEVVKLSHFGDE